MVLYVFLPSYCYVMLGGALYSQGVYSRSIAKPGVGDIVRFEYNQRERSVRVKINGADQGICFSKLPLSTKIYPAVSFYGKDRKVNQTQN